MMSTAFGPDAQPYPSLRTVRESHSLDDDIFIIGREKAMARRLVTVFGGSGFIGRHLVRRLAADGCVVRVAVRHREDAHILQPMGDVGQIIPFAADVTRDDSVAAAVSDAFAVVNLVGILFEKGGQTFQKLHAEAPGRIAAAAMAAGVERLVQMSALGADAASPSDYARTKAAGERAARAAFPQAVIVRPSVVFGPEDDFFNRFARLAVLSPILPVITGDGPRLTGARIDWFGSGGPRFQPVYVGDVAEALRKAVADPTQAGKTFELGGPKIYSLKEIMDLMLAETGRRRLLVPLPFGLAHLQALFLQLGSKPMLTPDQVRLMRRDNVVSGTQPGFDALGIAPTAAEAILPTYLSRYRRA